MDLSALPPLPWPKPGDLLVATQGSRFFNAWLPDRADPCAYVEGYKRTGDLIWEKLCAIPREIDFYVYPMVFVYRQFLELSLKDVIAMGSRLDGGSGTSPTGHRLAPLWAQARAAIERIGGCGADDLTAMTNLIAHFDAIDPESFAFRYPTTKSGARSLPNMEWLNLELFREGIEKMASFLTGTRMMFSDYEDHLDSLP